MARLHFLSGSIALIALAGVNAGPCRPSSSVVTTTTSLETTATMSADIDETTTVLFTSLATTESTETLAVTLSASETAVASTTAVASDTTTVVTTDAATTTADTTTTTAAATTSAAPAEACHGLPREYTTPQGTTFDIECGSSPSEYFRIFDQPDASDFKTCVDICAENLLCSGAIWYQGNSGCYLVDTYDGTEASDSSDFAKVR